jgi:light-regulated signal transduction histidine kinase (bacteriophytochrome)
VDVISQDRPFKDFEIDYDCPLLERRLLVLQAHRVTRDDDNVPMILLTFEDGTESRRVRDELRQLNFELELRVAQRTAELETANRESLDVNRELASANRELEAFCYSVSHDLRAPLRAIDGFSNELLRSHSEALDDKGKHFLQRVRAATQRMGDLIDDLLKLSQHSRGDMKRELVDLTAMAESVAAEIRVRDPSRQVAFEIQPDLTCRADLGLLTAVLENLLGNAWKFTEKTAKAAISVGLTEHQGRTAFFVRDNGAGFDMNHASKLFGAFQRLHPQREFPGNGIGLATVQRIIHRHGGQVWADSPPGPGATFYFTLPIKELA